MITLPKEFVTTKHQGYFWNIVDKQLYSVKITGALKPLKLTVMWNQYGPRGNLKGYNISVEGRKRFMGLDYLNSLTPTDDVYPVWTQLELI